MQKILKMLIFETFAKNVKILKNVGLKLKIFDANYIFFQRKSYLDNFFNNLTNIFSISSYQLSQSKVIQSLIL